MNIFVYEWVCGGGFLGRGESPPVSLVTEGSAMLSGICADFAKYDGVQVQTIAERDSTISLDDRVQSCIVRDRDELRAAFAELVDATDWTLLIAPEFEGILLGLADHVVEQGGKLLSPSPEFIAIASDKQSTAERLHAARVNVPRGTVLMPGERCPGGFRYPAVLKPLDGCGSLGVTKVEATDRVPGGTGAYRLEEFAVGVPASVLSICGEGQVVSLEPCLQRLVGEGDFSYLGGALPLPDALRERAIRLATAALQAMPAAVGFVGVDMVLGEADDGSQDVVIEINPRCTTSYVGLRAAYDVNLAELLLAVSNGEQVEQPTVVRRVEWDATGQVRTVG
ncbi:ATP-grasp domain-containing protein [Aeoliella sp. SH292]|uniref:ATP-grasp domain-containing protein n=1 Tax=Aeoliella sp. SH292 TaxID=3454464 RepID=UPI003F9C65DF